MTRFFTDAFNSLPPEERELQSADIGDGAVIGSGSVVVKPIPPFSVAVGVPARVIRKRGEPIGQIRPIRKKNNQGVNQNEQEQPET